MSGPPLSQDQIESHNAARLDAVQDEYDGLGRALDRRGIDIARIKAQVAAFSVALPSWGSGRGGTRFAKFPIAGEPTDIHEKLEDCAVVQQLSRVTPRVSPHFPWDKVDDYAGLRQEAAALGLGFDAVNSNTFQDQPGQAHSYRSGSLTATDPAVRAQAVAHNIECIEIGAQLGSSALTVWVGDGTNFPGQQDLGASLDRYLDSAAQIYAALPDGWRMLLEHKMYEPAFYSTVISDWGSSILAAQQLGDKAQCLVDLGHHAPNVNIEQIVARLHRFGKLGGFHFNDSKYGDDDLDSGSINPHQLFLVFNELLEAEANPRGGFNPAYMIDQSHNVTDPIESMLSSAEAIVGAYAKALIVDRAALHAAQAENDVMMGFQALRRGYRTDVTPLLAMARLEAGGAVDAIDLYRASGWRDRKAQERRPVGLGAGIV
ncbi:MAG: L-rhamnose catabolism isomerase [Alphaproteobacteria bacterium]|nr:L-rhamnose catabolism isomerase [Alphaproteobacteria bacterium]MBU1516758.1 L-rhamnose catabolism isomerase [Alphaproteobacteria bacterium]MBU2092452.1 L-rhamnose catabolism isomerase [Alphaproteobacteria bacterium]MBU2152694.1 L-rhamnose catabolism isomerase [Alphaproteobacteria bacterium]MBU2305628.1 L-rhamnose catabolism isomerase [Alphaproteobacteria bacterium]